jgi:hypothetical protein
VTRSDRSCPKSEWQWQPLAGRYLKRSGEMDRSHLEQSEEMDILHLKRSREMELFLKWMEIRFSRSFQRQKIYLSRWIHLKKCSHETICKGVRQCYVIIFWKFWCTKNQHSLAMLYTIFTKLNYYSRWVRRRFSWCEKTCSGTIVREIPAKQNQYTCRSRSRQGSSGDTPLFFGVYINLWPALYVCMYSTVWLNFTSLKGESTFSVLFVAFTLDDEGTYLKQKKKRKNGISDYANHYSFPQTFSISPFSMHPVNVRSPPILYRHTHAHTYIQNAKRVSQ